MLAIEAKLFEIHDAGAVVPCLAVRMMPDAEREAFVLRRAGQLIGSVSVLLTRLTDCVSHGEPNLWANERTMRIGHLLILRLWDELPDGSIVDVKHVFQDRAAKPQPASESKSKSEWDDLPSMLTREEYEAFCVDLTDRVKAGLVSVADSRRRLLDAFWRVPGSLEIVPEISPPGMLLVPVEVQMIDNECA